MQVELTYLEGRDIYTRVVIDGILDAKKSVWIATANLKDAQVEWKGHYVSILRPFEAMCERGIAVKILHAGVPSGPFLHDLCKGSLIGHANFRMRRCERVHFKAVITDGARLFVGSPNLTGAGMGAKGVNRRNFEIGFITSDATLLGKVSSLFKSVWDGRMCDDCGHKRFCPVPLEEPTADLK